MPTYLNPSLGEERAGGQDEDQVEHSVQRVVGQVGEGLRRRDVVGQPGH